MISIFCSVQQTKLNTEQDKRTYHLTENIDLCLPTPSMPRKRAASPETKTSSYDVEPCLPTPSMPRKRADAPPTPSMPRKRAAASHTHKYSCDECGCVNYPECTYNNGEQCEDCMNSVDNTHRLNRKTGVLAP